jgi:hypothetical protein
MVADDLPTTARLAALQRALDQAAEPEHARDVAAAAHGFEQAMRDAGLGKQIEELRPYRELWIMARWKLGKMLAKMVRGKPGPQKKDTSSGLTYLKDELDRLGLTKQTANETQRLAAFPEPELLQERGAGFAVVVLLDILCALRACPSPLGSNNGEQRDDRKRRSGKADILDACRNSI